MPLTTSSGEDQEERQLGFMSGIHSPLWKPGKLDILDRVVVPDTSSAPPPGYKHSYVIEGPPC